MEEKDLADPGLNEMALQIARILWNDGYRTGKPRDERSAVAMGGSDVSSSGDGEKRAGANSLEVCGRKSASVGLGRDGGASNGRESASVGLGRDGRGSDCCGSASIELEKVGEGSGRDRGFAAIGLGSRSGSEGSGGKGSPASDLGFGPF